MTERPQLTNWAGNVRYSAARLVTPKSVDELRRIVSGSSRLRAIGSAHSFDDIADTPGELVSVAGLPDRWQVADDRSTVTVGAGMRYGEVATRLQAAGLALHNLASLPHISVAGSIATGTHGSGVHLQGLAAAVRGLEMVTADGDLVRVTPEIDGEAFAGMVVALGCMGIVTAVKLAVEPAYEMSQEVHLDLPFERLVGDLDAVMSAGTSVSVFTTWGDELAEQVWVKRRTDEPWPDLGPEWLSTHASTSECHPVPGMAADACTPQLGLPGAWHERLPHFRMDHTPSSGAELQSELLVPWPSGAAALQAMHAVRRSIAPVLQVCEIRSVAADDLWLSPAYGTRVLALHCTWVADAAAVLPAMRLLDAALEPFQARPHWGKLDRHRLRAHRGAVSRLPEFQALRRSLRPTRCVQQPVHRDVPGAIGWTAAEQ